MGADGRLWSAPRAGAPVDAVVAVPGSKSLTNRALILAALADGPSTVSGALRARDSLLMGRALGSLGVGVAGLEGDGDILITPAPLRGPAHVDCGLAGNVMRFVPPLVGSPGTELEFAL